MIIGILNHQVRGIKSETIELTFSLLYCIDKIKSIKWYESFLDFKV
jgi:hypothetical protein